MANTAQGAALTEAHRLAQARLGAETVAEMLQLWGMLTPTDLSGPRYEAWLAAVTSLITNRRAASARTSATYFNRYRTFEADTAARFVAEPAVTASQAQISAVMSINVTARTRRSLGRGIGFEQAFETARTEAARAAQRLALDGGRGTIDRALTQDLAIVGFARATSGDPCHFCAMLASRGPVYDMDSFRRMEVHNGCNCALEPVYQRDHTWPAGSHRYRQIWDDAAAQADDGTPTAVIFRRMIEDRNTTPAQVAG